MSVISEQLALALDTIETISQKSMTFACVARHVNIASNSDLDSDACGVAMWFPLPCESVMEDPLSANKNGRDSG